MNLTEHQHPRQFTPFIGRQRELAKIAGLLCDPGCCLLTLVGPGGIGKTSLAIETTSRLADCFSDGVYFVPLQAVASPEFLPPAIADALGLKLSGNDDPMLPLLNYLRDKTLLLILDNIEQLLAAPALPSAETGQVTIDLLSDLLQAAPAVKLLVTSREVLNLQNEWLFPVEGLAVPVDTAAGDWANVEAAQLFVQRARQVRRDFPADAEAADMGRICRLVEGMPLALELAATWTKTMTCADVADEIQRSLDFLSTPLRDVPARHRNMRAIFDYTWEHLTPAEQNAFRQLSVFRGGFTREAAEAVAEAGLSMLSTLVNKSLLYWESDSRRYHAHELLRQFGEQQLAQAPEIQNQSQDLHAKYYTTFLGDRFNDLAGARQGTALAEIGVELGNIRAAWKRAVEQRFQAELEYAAMGLHTFYQYRGHFREGVDTFAAAVRAVEAAPPSLERDRALAALLNCAGWFEMRFGRIQAATRMQEKALALFESHKLLPAPGQGTDPLTALSLLAATRGDHKQALHLGRQAMQRAEDQSDRKNMAFAAHGLAAGALAQGDYESARQHAQAALALTEAAGNRWFMAYIYNQLGQINQASGRLNEAKNYYRASYTLKKELNDPEGMALALNYQGDIALMAQKAYPQAQELYQQSLAIYEKIGDRGGWVRAAYGLGMASHGLGHEPAARSHLQQALQVAAETQLAPLILSVLVGIGTCFLESDEQEQGVTMLTFVRQHPAADQMMKNHIDQLLETHQRTPQADVTDLELDTLVTTLLAQLSTAAILVDEAAGAAVSAIEQPLIEPLSERELEVLRLIADGLSNRQIAERLTVVIGTVKAHSSNIYGKLGVSSRTQAIARARELNLI